MLLTLCLFLSISNVRLIALCQTFRNNILKIKVVKFSSSILGHFRPRSVKQKPPLDTCDNQHRMDILLVYRNISFKSVSYFLTLT